MRFNPWTGGIAIALMIALSGCGQTRQALGLVKDPPDEFQVVSRAPLSLPPNFNLRPPQPGTPRPQEGTARDQAASALLGESRQNRTQTAHFDFGNLEPGGALGDAYGGVTGPSAGERALLAQAGATDVDPSVREVIERETAAMIDQDSNFVERLVFWRDPVPFGTVIDPVKEQERLQENEALGRPVTEGETPVIERKRRAPLEGLF